MTSPVQTRVQDPEYLNNEEALRRIQRNAELAGIRDLLTQNQMNDTMTQSIRDWFNNFQTAFSSAVVGREARVEREVRGNFIQSLQQILVDAIYQSPLDEETFLGSDRRTYTRRSLRRYQDSVPSEFRMRSPLNPENPAPLTFVPHPVVRYMIGWLDSHHARLTVPEMKAFNRPLEQEIMPPPQVPVEHNAGIRRILAIQAEREQQRNQQFDYLLELQEIERELPQRIERNFAPIIQRVEEHAQMNFRARRELEEREREQIGVLQERIVTELTNQIEEHERQIQELDRRINDLTTEVEMAKNDDAVLERLIHATHIAIKKKKKSNGLKMFALLLPLWELVSLQRGP